MNTIKHDLPNGIMDLLEASEDAKLRGDHTEAIKLAEQALIKDPSCTEALEEIADNYLAMNLESKAENAARFALETNPHSYTALYILGFLESRKNHFEVAITHLEKANQIRPNNPEILRALGWAYFMEDKRVKGLVILERALNLSHEDVMILCDLGICYVKNGQPDKALDLFYRAMEIDPNDERIKDCIKLAEEVKNKK